MRNLIACAVLLFVCSSLPAQITVGAMPAVSSSYSGMGPSTVIDLGHPATANGTLNTAAVRWNIGCASAFKLKFLHSNYLTTYSVFAERGPFDAVTGTNLVTLSPPVDVQKGDLIAVTQVASAQCGGFYYSPGPQSAATMYFHGDIPNDGQLNGELMRGRQLNVRAASSTNVCEGVIAGAGAAAGAFGAYFRTALQLTNRDSTAMTGRLVFHPAGQSGSASDPSLAYNVPASRVISIPDVITAMGVSGLGSLDIISTSGSRPLVVARVFNDAGDAGSSGFTEEIVTPADALQSGDFAYITMPADVTNFRMNIGVRTLEAGVTIDVWAMTSSNQGIFPRTTKTYAPNYFEQVGLQQFIGNVPPVANGVIRLYVTGGSAIIYATTTDNRTNDSSIDFALRE